MPLRSKKEIDEMIVNFEESIFDISASAMQATQAKLLARLVLLLEDIHDLLRDSNVKKGK